MYTKNLDTNIWEKQKESLDKKVYNNLRQDLESLRIYSRCLDGTSYILMNDLDNIYDILNYKRTSWYYPGGIGDIEINETTWDSYTNFLDENGLFLKNSFKPISDPILYVDLASDSELDLTKTFPGLVINGVRALEGHLILIKDQKTYITLSSSINPDIYFSSNYHVINKDASTIDYFIYNDQNGVYRYSNNKLVRVIHNNIVSVKSLDTQFHLSRLLSGYYPGNNEPVEFLEKKNWLLRNKVEYQNVLDIDFYDSIRDSRSVFVGDFGSIYVLQDHLVIIKNKYKNNLRAIVSTNYYWICGELGTLLRVNKLDFEITRMNLDSYDNFTSIDFFNNSLGVVVGTEIWYTMNGGLKWSKIDISGFSFNKVIYTDLSKFYVVGDNGVFIEFNYNNGKWVATYRTPIKIESVDDEFKLVTDINDIIKINFDINNPWNLGSTTDKEGLLMVGSDNTILIYNMNNFVNEEYLYLDPNIYMGDINKIVVSNQDFYLISDKHYRFDINTYTSINNNSNIIPGTSILVNNNLYNNLYNYDSGLQLVSNNLSLSSYTYSSPSIINDLVSPLFLSSKKSKLLIMDYDIGSKLNWFGDNTQYRLPSTSSVTISSTSSIIINSLPQELSWIDYDKDKLMTIEYNTSNQVLYNTEFISSTNSTTTITYTQSTNRFTDIENLLNITYSPTYSLFMYDKLLILKSNIDVISGDLILMDSPIVNTTLLVNRVENLGGDQFIYMNSFFSENITNDIISSTSSISFNNLNRHNDYNDLISNFNNHYLGRSYIAELGATTSVSADIIFSPYLSAVNAYYNLAIDINGTQMVYSDLFLNFGYTATYNILDYLSNIDPVFSPSKEFPMPDYTEVVNNSGILINNNKLSFHSSLEYMYNTLFTNTFVDINIDSLLTTKLLIYKKYYDINIDRYIIEFHKEIISPTTPINISIRSRKLLSEISSDLNEVNNIQRELNFKFNTDSYTKIFISDLDIQKHISMIINNDIDNELNLLILNTNTTVNMDIVQINSIPTINGLLAKIITNIDHNLVVGDYIIIKDSVYQGFQVVTQIVSNTQFVINVPFSTIVYNTKYYKYNFDPYMNYEPIDVAESTDKVKISNVVSEFSENNNKYSITISNDYKFNLVDGLYLDIVQSRWPWMLEAEIINATIGVNNDGLVWYNGTWICGRWINGTWMSGTWLDGTWYGGNWESNLVTTTIIGGSINRNVKDNSLSTWLSGRWFGGTWFGGIWRGGIWSDGDWTDGEWTGGTWLNGTWLDGVFKRGTWVDGEWLSGRMNCDKGLSTWINGTWRGGDFECGIWMNGVFTGDSRFGIGSSNSRKSIWSGGKWLMGEFHSVLTEFPNHKYSIWLTGTWYNGTWVSGTAFNINFIKGTWIDGVLKEIIITEFLNDTVYIPGVYRFNNMDEFYIIDNLDNSIYDSNGTNENPGMYLVKDVIYEYVLGQETNTYVQIYGTFSTGSTNINSTIVSKISGTWLGGIWWNGIFDGDIFAGGMWIRGSFMSGEFL